MSSFFTFQSTLCALVVLQGATELVSIVRGTVGDCVILDLHNCTYMNIQTTWKKGNMLVAKMKSYSVNGSGAYKNRFHAFPNGSLRLCPMWLGDEGQYTAEVFDHGGINLCHRTIRLEHDVRTDGFSPSGNETASVQKVKGIVGGSVFLQLPGWNDLVQITWRKGSLLVAGLNYSQSESYGEYTTRAEILPNGTLRLDRIQKSDCGRYSVEVRDRDGKIIYQRMIDLKVEQEMASTVDARLLLFTVVGVHVVVFIVVLGSLIWHFGKCKRRTGHMKNVIFRRVSWHLRNYNEDILEAGEPDVSRPDQEENGNRASQQPEAANSTKPENEAFVKNVKETTAATAANFYTEQPLSLNISTFQGIEESKSQLRTMHAGNYVASVTKDCVIQEDGNDVPQDDRDYVPPDFDGCAPPYFDGCGPPVFDNCPHPGFDDCPHPGFDDCPHPVFDDCPPPDFDDCPPPDFDDCLPPDFDDYPPPDVDECAPTQFEDCAPPQFHNSGPMDDWDNIPVVNGDHIPPDLGGYVPLDTED